MIQLVYNDNEMDDNSRYPKDKINVKDQMIILIKNHFSNNKKVFLRDVVKKLPLSIEDRIDERFWKTLTNIFNYRRVTCKRHQ